jgi:hypothetical protein
VLIDSLSEADPTVSVVMPTMNEEEGIAECIEWVKTAVKRSGYQTEVIISDASTDRTPDIASQKGAIVVEPDKPGYGYAYRYAFERCRGDYIVIGDADTTYDFKQFPELLSEVVEGNADMVMGSRLEGDIKDGAMPALHEYVGNPLLTRFLNLFYDAGVSDAHSGFRAFRADMIEELELETTGMEFASEMIMEAGAQDLNIKEIPITYYEREGEATLESFTDGWRHLRFMLLNAPNYLFSIPGIMFSIIGIGLLASGALGFTVGGVGLGTTVAVGGSMLVLVGYQVASMGVFNSLVGDPIQRPEGPAIQMIIDEVSLEGVATTGIAVFILGSLYLAWAGFQSLSGGTALLYGTASYVIGFTVMVLGIQTVFNAFFMNAIDHQPSTT